MVFAKISALVQTQWRLLRTTFDAEGHEHRVQQRYAKMQSKQQRKAARISAREARRAQRKQWRTLFSRTAVERSMTSSSPRAEHPEASGGLVGAPTAGALTDVTVANEGASCFTSESRGLFPVAPAPRLMHEASPECVDEKPAVADVTALTIAKTMEAVLQLSEFEAQLEQKQREFYNSLGGYSTVDEDDDELLPAVLVGGRPACDAKLPSNPPVAGIKKAASLSQESEAVLPEATEQEEATGVTAFFRLSASPSSVSKSRPKSLLSPSELVDTEPEDEEVDLRDSIAFDGYNTFGEEDESQDLFGLCAPPSDNSSAQCSGEASIEAFETKVHPQWCDVGQDDKVENEDEEEVAVKNFIVIDLNEEELPELSTVLEEHGTKKLPGTRDFSNEYKLEAAQPLDAKDKLSAEELVGTEYEGSKDVKEVESKSKGVSKDVEKVEQEVMIKVEESLYPADEDMHRQQASVSGSPYQSLASPPGIYSPGTVDEYSCSIYENLRMREHRYHVTEDIFAKQQSVRPKMRAVLVDWLIEVHQRFDLEAQTLYLTVNYVDRYLAQASVNPQRFQLVGVAALLIASKFEEIYPCNMDDLLYICERSYSKTDLVDCERDLLNVFEFNLAVPSVSSFLGYYLEYFEEEDKLIGQLANYFAECSLLDFTFGATYEPSIVACACLLAAYCFIENQAPSLVWHYRLVELTGYAVEVIVPCTQDLSSILIQPTELTAVAIKYSGHEFGEVSHLLLDDLVVLLR